MTQIPRDVAERLNVSRETLEKLVHLSDLLVKWNPKINLVSKSTLSELWTRHILDSAQVYRSSHVSGGKWVDIGSGGGFPGLVVAIMNAGDGNTWDVTMIESDLRKCTFLRTVLRETGCPATVLTERIEKVEPQGADVLSARALADLSQLCVFSERHLKPEGTGLFPKGINWKKEVQDAQESWSFTHEAIKSETQEGAVILKIRELKRV